LNACRKKGFENAAENPLLGIGQMKVDTFGKRDLHTFLASINDGYKNYYPRKLPKEIQIYLFASPAKSRLR